MIIYDFEVFKHDTLLGTLNEETGEIIQTWSIPEIKENTEANLNNIWVGYNCEHYDKILLHGILTKKLMTPDKVFACSNSVIHAQDYNIPVFNVLGKYDIKDYYSSPILSYDVMGDGSFMSLKQNEGFMGMDIVESVVPFDIDRPLTPEEKADVEKYNRADLYGTLERFKQRRNTFKTKMMLVKEFELPLNYICKTNAKLTEAILLSQNKGVNNRLRKGFQLCDLPCNWDVPEIKAVYDFFCEALEELESHKWDTKKCNKKKLTMDINILGVLHTFALGGVHGGIKNYICRPEDKKKIVWVDVSSLYPNILCQWDLLSRKVDKNGVEAFKNMVQVRMDIKAKLHDDSLSKDEKKALKDQAARYKLILNTTSGCMKDKFKKIYDPEYNTKMCMLGQLSLLDLIFRLHRANKIIKTKPSWALNPDYKETDYFTLIQSNTDGIALELLTDNAEDIIDNVCAKWEKDWRFNLEKTVADNLYEKDVNNYVFKDSGGKIKVKGAYVTKYSEDNEQDTLAILAKAVVDYFLEGTDIRTTICNPENLATDYQMIKKLGGMYDTPTWKRDIGDVEVQKVNRIFPSVDKTLGGLYKHHKSKDVGTLDKVEGTPEHLLIYNEDIRGKKIGELENIDYEWYIAEAQKRINDFLGIKLEKKTKKKKVE
ncbi:MAG: hypothetical protein K2P14_10305 [Anaeroplasmataceae bacterium]|nr:hypothetical protein [Anaeroplasmataceae bacterium]